MRQGWGRRRGGWTLWTPWLRWMLLWTAMLGAACGLSAEAASTPPRDPNPNAMNAAVTFAPIVTMTRPASTPPSAAPDTPDTSGVLVASAAPGCEVDGPPVRYEADVQIDAPTHSLSATLRATYRNTTGSPLSSFVMNVDANRSPGLFTLDDLRIAPPAPAGIQQIEQYALNGPRLEITLDGSLQPGCALTVVLRFGLKVPPLAEARMKYLSYTERQINLGCWLPEIAPYIAGAWRTPKQWTIGEYTSSVMADFVVRAVLRGGGERGEIIGPGAAKRLGDANWEFTLKGGRSFALVVSDAMARMSSRTADDSGGLALDLYYFPKGGEEVGPRHALEVARQTAERLARLFGPMPYDRLVVVEGDFPDGMEASGIVHVGHQWFAGYKGQPDSWLTLITAHEVAHQWWYALVANDQGESPYLDEALALYSELLYLEAAQPALVPWWWTFRVKMYQPKGYVDSTVYEYWNARLYINAVYLRGAQMVHEIREALGDAAFFGWLRAYIEAARGKIATPIDFWKALGPENYSKTAPIRLKYLRQPDVLPATAWERDRSPQPPEGAGEQ